MKDATIEGMKDRGEEETDPASAGVTAGGATRS